MLMRATAVGALAVVATGLRLSFVSRTLIYPYDSYYYLGTARSLAEHFTYNGKHFSAVQLKRNFFYRCDLFPFRAEADAKILYVQ